MSKVYTSVTELIGRTPLIELVNIEKKYDLKAKVVAKLELFNPAGSVKDRVARAMVEDAEKSGSSACISEENGTNISYKSSTRSSLCKYCTVI